MRAQTKDVWPPPTCMSGKDSARSSLSHYSIVVVKSHSDKKKHIFDIVITSKFLSTMKQITSEIRVKEFCTQVRAAFTSKIFYIIKEFYKLDLL